MAGINRWWGISKFIPQSEKSGELYHEDKHIRAFIDGSGNITHFVGKGRDIDASIQTKKRLGYLTSHDVRTGRPNRNLCNLYMAVGRPETLLVPFDTSG